MAPTEFILIEHHGAKEPRRQHELQIALLKSHAAKISHAKRKKRRQQEMLGPCDQDQTSLRYRPDEGCESVARLPRPRTLVGQSKSDPFHSVPASDLPDIMLECMEYVYEVLWPINSPGLQGAVLRSVIQSWRQAAVDSPLEFHAQVSNAASLCFAETTDPAAMRTLSMVRIVHQSKAIQLIQEAVTNLDGPPSVALITCILNMFVQGNHIVESTTERDMREPRLFQAFNIRKYGRFVITRDHFEALIALAFQRGGLEALPLGLANPLQLADLAGATQTITNPVFPLLRVLVDQADSHQYNFDVEAAVLLQHLGRGFNFRGEQDRIVALKKLLEKACRLTAGADQLERNSRIKSRMHELAVQSIVLQHGTLCLPSSFGKREQKHENEHEDDEDEMDDMYEITRIAALIYNDLVFFPTPLIWQVRQRLAEMLKERLARFFSLPHHSDNLHECAADDLALWALILGGVAASNTANREWYVAQTLSRTTRRHLSWERLHAILRSFLYWEAMLDAPVTALWVEAFQSHQMMNLTCLMPRRDSAAR